MPPTIKEAGNAYSKAYCQGHKGVINARAVAINKRRRHERYAEVAKLKSAPCTDCGKTYAPCGMDFDHRDPSAKTDDVSSLVKRMVAWETVLDEIAKCDLVCVCCHRLRTYKGQNCCKTRRFEQHRAIRDELKSTTPYLDCGGSFQPCPMDFDHTGEVTKTANIARLAGGSTETLLAEIQKCHLVCANGHRVRGETGVHPEGGGGQIVQRFKKIEARVNVLKDQRFVPFLRLDLLGVVPDKELAAQTGISRPMVAWYRRKAGIVLTRQGERAV